MPSQRQRTRVYFPNVLGIAQHLIPEELETLVCSESLVKPQPAKPVLGGARACNIIGRHGLDLPVAFKKQNKRILVCCLVDSFGSVFLIGRMKPGALTHLSPNDCTFLLGASPLCRSPRKIGFREYLCPGGGKGPGLQSSQHSL